jgi:hypothetical protein
LYHISDDCRIEAGPVEVASEPVPETAAALTDLALGVATLSLMPLLRASAVNVNWRRTVGWAAAAALAGAVHHEFIASHKRWAGPSWAVISGLVVLTISFVLAATVADVLGPGRRLVFWVLRAASLVAYAVLALFGHYGIATILACEGVTMLCVLALWGLALRRHDPRARPMIVALAVSAVAGCTRALPGSVTHLVGLDPTSLYHLAQIPPMVLLCLALTQRSTASPPACGPPSVQEWPTRGWPLRQRRRQPAQR